MHFFSRIFRFFIYSNFYVSLAAGLLALETKMIFDSFGLRVANLEENPFSFLINDLHFWLVFCLTFSSYNFQRLVKVKSKDNFGFVNSEKGKFFMKHFVLLSALSAFAMLFVFLHLIDISLSGLLVLIFCGINSFLYVRGIKKLVLPPLRSLPYVKIFLITIVWTLICGLFPIMPVNVFPTGFVYYLIALGVFIFAITIPFDIRDVEVDKANNVITFPVKLREERSRQLSYAALIIYVGIIFLMLMRDQVSPTHVIALILSAFVSAVIISFSKKERPEFFFSGLVEGTIVLQFLLVLIAEYTFG